MINITEETIAYFKRHKLSVLPWPGHGDELRNGATYLDIEEIRLLDNNLGWQVLGQLTHYNITMSSMNWKQWLNIAGVDAFGKAVNWFNGHDIVRNFRIVLADVQEPKKMNDVEINIEFDI